jgi:arylsulfatase A-like enzyme
MKGRRLWLASATLACVVAACSRDDVPQLEPSSSTVITSPFLLEHLDAATVELTQASTQQEQHEGEENEDSPQNGGTGQARQSSSLHREADGRILVHADIGARRAWQKLPSEVAKRMGVDHPKQTGWYLALPLPTNYPDAVETWRAAERLERWQRQLSAPPFSAFYQPGGFVREGLYLALPSAVDPAELRLAVRFRPTAAALANQLAAQGEVLPPAALVSRATVDGVTRPSLLLTPGVTLSLPLYIPESASLRFTLARTRGPGAPPGSGASVLRVGFRDASDGEWRTEERIPFPGKLGDPWKEVNLDLAGIGGRSGQLVLEVERAGPSSDSIFHFVGDPALAQPTGESRPNVLLIVVDGLRADRLFNARLAPTLARLAEDGLSFASARSAAPWTRPSISSLFTGTLPSRHGVERERNSDVLPTGLPTLAGALRQAGYATGAVSANLHLHPAFGLDRGFGYLRADLEDGHRLSQRVLEWIDTRPVDPFFAFAFYMDTHHPFHHRPGFDRSSHLEADEPAWGKMTSGKARARAGAEDPSPKQVEYVAALYDENVQYSDEGIAMLLKGLEERGLLKDTLVVVTADHGEAFAEHGDLFHGWNLYEELLHVPLIANGGPLTVAGRREMPVSLIDLAASILSLLGISVDEFPGWPGLLAATPGEGKPAPTYAETRFRGADAAAIVDGPDKLIWHREDGESELYDLVDDPGERDDVSEVHAERAAALQVQLEDRLSTLVDRRADQPSTPTDARVPREVIDKLEALGYLP